MKNGIKKFHFLSPISYKSGYALQGMEKQIYEEINEEDNFSPNKLLPRWILILKQALEETYKVEEKGKNPGKVGGLKESGI